MIDIQIRVQELEGEGEKVQTTYHAQTNDTSTPKEVNLTKALITAMMQFIADQGGTGEFQERPANGDN